MADIPAKTSFIAETLRAATTGLTKEYQTIIDSMERTGHLDTGGTERKLRNVSDTAEALATAIQEYSYHTLHPSQIAIINHSTSLLGYINEARLAVEKVAPALYQKLGHLQKTAETIRDQAQAIQGILRGRDKVIGDHATAYNSHDFLAPIVTEVKTLNNAITK